MPQSTLCIKELEKSQVRRAASAKATELRQTMIAMGPVTDDRQSAVGDFSYDPGARGAKRKGCCGGCCIIC